MIVECGCGNWHDMTPTAMVVVIQAFRDGELHRVSGKPTQVKARCLLQAFTEDNVRRIAAQYPKRTIEVTA